MVDVEVSQWCPVLRSVVYIVVRGELSGDMVDGEVTRCQAYTSGSCREIHLGFCLVGKRVWVNRGV